MKSYPAKLLLLGEHTVNLGSQALAMPLTLFSGYWRHASPADKAKLPALQRSLPEFVTYLEQLHLNQATFIQLDIASFYRDLSDGLYFASDIPSGYGAGSSGALVAAVFDRYSLVREGNRLDLLKEAFAQMEAFFHGKSSGTDPLVCYLQQPLLMAGKADIRPVTIPEPGNVKLFLLDTGRERQATPLIEYFLKKSREDSFIRMCNDQLLPAVDGAITSILSGAADRLFQYIHEIGAFQLSFLGQLVPEKFRPIWKEGLDSDYFKLKVCGAGGGGFIMGVATDLDRLRARHPDQRILEVPLGDAARP